MKITVFHGSPRKGNTYQATRIFMDELSQRQDVQVTEFFLPAALPVFCTGCQLCMSAHQARCPHAFYVSPIYDAVMTADALVFATPHHGGSSMSAGMKSLLDHLDFLTLTVTPRQALFTKKAFIITTAAGATAAVGQIARFLKNWGMNRVYFVGIRMFTSKWQAMPLKKQARLEKKLRKKANRFYDATVGAPYITTIFMYYMSKWILKKMMGKEAYPYQYWEEQGYFKKRPF